MEIVNHITNGGVAYFGYIAFIGVNAEIAVWMPGNDALKGLDLYDVAFIDFLAVFVYQAGELADGVGVNIHASADIVGVFIAFLVDDIAFGENAFPCIGVVVNGAEQVAIDPFIGVEVFASEFDYSHCALFLCVNRIQAG